MGKFNLIILVSAIYFVSSYPIRPAEIADLQGRWTVIAIVGAPTGDSSRSVHFEIKGTAISGFDGCNSFGGSLDKPDEIITTQRECATGTSFDIPNLVRNIGNAKLVAGRLTVTVGPRGREIGFSKQD